MEKYQLVKAESFHKDFIIKLNSENMPAVGRLDEKLFKRFLEHSDYFKLVKYDNQSVSYTHLTLPTN